MKFDIGERVSLMKGALSVSYIACRSFYTNMYEGKKGRVIGYAETGKVAVEFDDKVFRDTGRELSHNNGCHGRGKKNYCWYIPEEYLESVSENNELLLLV